MAKKKKQIVFRKNIEIKVSRTQRCKICRLNDSEVLPWQLIYWFKQLGKSIKALFSEKRWMRREKLKSWLLFEKSVLAYPWKSTKEKRDMQVCTVVRVFSWGCELSSLWQVAGYGLAMIVIEDQLEEKKKKTRDKSWAVLGWMVCPFKIHMLKS